MKNLKVNAAALALAGSLLLTGTGLEGRVCAFRQPKTEITQSKTEITKNVLETKEMVVAKGVNIYVDEYPYQPKDANGNPVDKFIYNGTTYLPVRAISNIYGSSIRWDGATNSVFIGRPSGITINNSGYVEDTKLVTETITAAVGVAIYVENEQGEYERFIPRDGNGNEVPVILYNGTTYVPARAISNIFNTNIEWDGEHSRVYIGKRLLTKEDFKVQMEEDLVLFEEWYKILEDAKGAIPSLSYLTFLVQEKATGEDYEEMERLRGEIINLYEEVREYLGMRYYYYEKLKNQYLDVLEKDYSNVKTYYGNGFGTVKMHLWSISRECLPESLGKYLDVIEEMALKVGVDLSSKRKTLKVFEYCQ